MSEKLIKRTGILSLMILLAALSRLLPHPPNFTPIGALALFGAAYFHRKELAFAVPLVAMWVSDLILNNAIYAKAYPELYNGFVFIGSLWVYLGILVIALLGLWMLKKVNVPNLLGASLMASVLFFLVTNFGCFLVDPMYPKHFAGLMSAYAMGIPFFWNTLLGDLFFTAVLFGGFELVKRRFPVLQLS